jgi:hypothetical protein
MKPILKQTKQNFTKQNSKAITTITMVMYLLHNEPLNIHGIDYLPFIMEITKAIASFWRRQNYAKDKQQKTPTLIEHSFPRCP